MFLIEQIKKNFSIRMVIGINQAIIICQMPNIIPLTSYLDLKKALILI